MKEGEECNLCLDTLTEACNQFGATQPEFCGLKEQYLTDPNIGSDEVITKLTELFTPEQKQTIVDSLVEKAPSLTPSPPPGEVSLEMP